MNGVLLVAFKCYARALVMVLLLIAFAYVSMSAARAAPADDGQAIFQQKCQSCHSIGEGRRVGPDLAGVTSKRDRNWLLRTIVAPDQLVAQGDPIAKQLVQEFGMAMPNLGISSKDAEALLAYLEVKSGQGQAAPVKAAKAAEPSAPPSAPATIRGDAAVGRGLFTGEASFVNGGVACISCHGASSVGGFGGGNLARDLTRSYANLGQNGLKAVLTSVPFPLMKEAFASHPLTESEVENLAAFLQQESASATAAEGANPYGFVLAALVVSVVFLGLIHLVWLRRLQGVRQPLLKGGSR